MSQKGITLDRTVKWLNKTEGRDKFCKAIQYACRFLKFHAEAHGNKDAALKFNGLFVGMRDARKLFRLFKSINEYQKLMEILAKGSIDPFELGCNVISRVAFLLYWFFDNITILSNIKVLNRDSKATNKAGMTFWFIALLANLILIIRDLLKMGPTIKYYERQPESQDNTARLKQHKKKRFELILNLVKTLGDLVPSGMGSEILPKLGLVFNDSSIGLGGFISAIITSYQLYE